MILMYLSLGYMVGVAAGRLAWNAGRLGCETPDWLWLAALALLPATLLVDLLIRRFSLHQKSEMSPAPAMRWPASAGFTPPRTATLSPALVIALLLVMSAGALRYASHPLTPCWTPDDLAYYNLPSNQAFERDAPQVMLEGYISSYPLETDGRQRMHVRVDTLIGAGKVQPVAGELRLSTGADQAYVYGQPVRLRGRLVTPPTFEDFDYRAYLARKGVHSLMYSAKIEPLEEPLRGSAIKRWLYAFRARGEEVLNQLLPEPYAALANGMLLGIEAGIPQSLYDQFNLTGTSHVIVISGSNVALIAAVFMAMGARLLGRKRAVYPALVGIAAFAILVGGDPAVMRAALMGGLFVWAIALNRRSTALVSLAVACLVMTLANPLTLWDVGFQLSSAATAGLILFTDPVTAAFTNFFRNLRPRQSPIPQSPISPAPALPMAPVTALATQTRSLTRAILQDGLLVTIAANVTTLPLVVYYFGRLSLVSLLTNVLIAPVQPLIMLWGSAGVLAGVAGLSWVAQALLWIPWLSLVWTVAMVQWSAALPGASLTIAGYGTGALFLTYALIFGARWRKPLRAGLARMTGWMRFDWRSRLLGPVTLAVLAVLVVLVWRVALTQPDGRLHVYFLDIGQGDGILIVTPSGRKVLIDGGSSAQGLFNELGAVMPFWDRTIDVALLTHPDADHMKAQVDAPGRFKVTYALDTVVSQANPDAQPWRDAMASADVDVQLEHEGGWLDLGDGVALWVLWPPPGGFDDENLDNENSLVTKLVYGDLSVLLTGDAGLPSEAAWIERRIPIASTVLKVGHHGSHSATSAELIQAMQPLVAVIQVGADNDYGHPHQEVLERLKGLLTLRTDQQGRVHLYSDGRRMWIETEKKR